MSSPAGKSNILAVMCSLNAGTSETRLQISWCVRLSLFVSRYLAASVTSLATLCISQDQMSQPLEDQQGYRAHALSVHQCLMSSSISYDPWQASLLKVAGSSHLSWTHRCTPRKWNWNKGSIYSHPSWELDICFFLSLLVHDLADQADFQASPSLRWLILTQIRISRI